MRTNKVFSYLLISTSLGFLSACSNDSNNIPISPTPTLSPVSYDTTTTAVLGASVAGFASAADSSGTVVSLNKSSQKQNPHLAVDQLLAMLIENKAQASSCFSSAAVKGATCSGTSMTLYMGGCQGLLGAWSGGFTLTYDSATSCTNASTGGLLAMGANASVTITTTNASVINGGYIISLSSASSGFSNPVSGGIMVTCGSTDCSTSRSVNILGLNRILMSTSGTTIYNHTLSTPTPLTITGSFGNKQITAGQIQIQHNIAQYVATSTVYTPITFSSVCCLPTGGNMSTTFSNGKSGQENVSFSPTCGLSQVSGNYVQLNFCS